MWNESKFTVNCISHTFITTKVSQFKVKSQLAIHVASVNGQQEILKILLENGADPDLTDEFVNIYQTARDKNLQSLDVMVAREEEFNSNLNLRANFRGCTALHYAALADDYESIRILLGLCNL